MGFLKREPEEEDFEMEERGFVRPKKAISPQVEPGWKKRKKKDNFKPWGKKERYLLLAVLISTVLISSILALSSRAWKIGGFPKIALPKISLFKEEVLVVTKDNVSENPIKEKGEKIIKEFREKTRDLSGIYALYVSDLSSGYSFGVNENETMDAASLIKLPVMAAVYRSSEAGEINLDDKAKGSDRSYRDLLRAMGKRSDNTAQTIVIGGLGKPMIEKTISDLGMTNTSYEENQTTARNIGEYFEKLWNGKIMDSKNKEEMLGFLTDTIYEDYLKKGVPEDVRVAHKFGTLLHVINDAGIVYSKNPYVVVVMTKGVVDKEAIEKFPVLSEIVYENMTKE